MDTPHTDTPPSPPGRRLRANLVAAGAALGMTLAGLGFAAAQEDAPTNQTPPADAQGPGTEQSPRVGHARGGRHMKGMHGPGMGIHGEFTTRAPGGGYQTIATQTGEVTEVSRTSVTVRSEDGFSRTYAVDDNTLVNAGNDGIADVRQGDQVHVTAIVADGNARAVDIKDLTQTRALRERWAPPRD